MHFVSEDWGLAWAAAVALLAALFPLVRRGARNGPKSAQLSLWPSSDKGRGANALIRRWQVYIWAFYLLFLALLPLATTFPPGLRPASPPKDPDITAIVRAASATERTMTRLADSQQALVEEIRKKPTCSACGGNVASTPAGPRLWGLFGWWSVAGFLALLAGLWLAFYGWRRPSAAAEGSLAANTNNAPGS